MFLIFRVMPRKEERQSANLHRLSKVVVQNIKHLRERKMELEQYDKVIYCINSYMLQRELEIKKKIWIYVTITGIDKELKDYVKAKTGIDL